MQTQTSKQTNTQTHTHTHTKAFHGYVITQKKLTIYSMLPLLCSDIEPCIYLPSEQASFRYTNSWAIHSAGAVTP